MTVSREPQGDINATFREITGLKEYVETARRVGSMLFVVGAHADPKFMDWELDHLSNYHGVSRPQFEGAVTRYLIDRSTELSEMYGRAA